MMAKKGHTFHEIEEIIGALLAQHEEFEGTDEEQAEWEAALESALSELADAEAAKADGIAFKLGEMEARAKAMKETEESIKRRRWALENDINRLKTYVFRVMDANGLNNIKGQSATLYILKTQSVSVDNPASLPEAYQRIIPAKVEADKAKLKKGIKGGENIPGAVLIESATLAVKR